MSYAVIYRDGKTAPAPTWERVKFLVRQARALPPPFWPILVARVPDDEQAGDA